MPARKFTESEAEALRIGVAILVQTAVNRRAVFSPDHMARIQLLWKLVRGPNDPPLDIGPPGGHEAKSHEGGSSLILPPDMRRH
jgi:hypothetical protein